MSNEYIKIDDLIKELEKHNIIVSNNIYIGRTTLETIKKIINNLPTTEIKQDRLEVIKEYCEKQKNCNECVFEDEEYNKCFLNYYLKQPIAIFAIDEAIAKIKEQEK